MLGIYCSDNPILRQFGAYDGVTIEIFAQFLNFSHGPPHTHPLPTAIYHRQTARNSRHENPQKSPPDEPMGRFHEI
jgi:hypothetical protein